MIAPDLIKLTGQHLLFLGISTYSWSIDQFRQAAQFAKAHGVDSLIVKVADGVNEWYGGIANTNAICDAIKAEGVGVIPYVYSYGNKLGALDAEIDIMLAYMRDCGIVCVDMEEEWNGQVQWAQHLCSRIQPIAGTFMVSTWANPSGQDWLDVIQALAPCTTVFMPQQYNNYLATFWAEFGASGAIWLQPTINLTQDFGANDPVAIAAAAYAQRHTAISVWHYETAVANPALLDAVYAAFPKQGTLPNLNIIPAAQDTWNSTAFLFGGTPLDYTTGIAQAWQNLYVNQQINMPPPTTREFMSADWNGNKITVQFFGTVRCEWDTSGQAHWYRTGI